ncbi:MAG: AraC family transcriptional regulator [Adhaeribacter sp.]|nr:AraC family transcriptional regulator [Adhaeribacter sp.]
MSENLLPIYQIQDFAETASQGPGFYLNRFEQHLQQHAFIQKPHKHDFYIILLVTQGTGTHTIDFITYPVNPQTIFFISPGQVHAWELSTDTAGHILFFNTEFYRLASPQQKIYRFPFFNTLLRNPLLPVSPAQAINITGLLKHISQEHAGHNRQWEEVIRYYLNILLIQLGRFFEDHYGHDRSAMPHYPAWEYLEELLEQHYKQHEPVSFYAAKLHISVRQLNGIAKNTLNKTVLELLQDRILLEARRLLTHSGLTITQVAAELGYFDNSYFARFFKKHTGQTPEQFRQSIL